MSGYNFQSADTQLHANLYSYYKKAIDSDIEISEDFRLMAESAMKMHKTK